MIEQAYEHAEAADTEQLCEDEARPYQAIPQPGEDWHLDGHPTSQPHEYVRGGTAKLLTLFRPATGEVRATSVLSAPNVVLHPWLQDELQSILDQLDKTPLQVRVPLPEDHPLLLTWQHWWWSYERPKPAPALRLILIWDNLKGHLSYHMVRWLLQHGILPLYTPLSGSWLNMAESVQRIIVRRALSGQHPQSAQQVIDWLEQTMAGWNKQPTPFVWNGKRRRRRERARMRRLGSSGPLSYMAIQLLLDPLVADIFFSMSSDIEGEIQQDSCAHVYCCPPCAQFACLLFISYHDFLL